MFCLLFNLFLVCFLGLTYAGQETFEIQNLYEAALENLHTMSQSAHPLAVSVSNEHIHEVSSSVLKAETWLRTHVLSHFPAVKITTILVGNTISCQNAQNYNLGMVLPSVRNIYYSLTRWGLERDIKVSPAFESHCFHSSSALFNDGLAEKVTEPLFRFLHGTNSTYSRNVPSKNEMVTLESSHIELLKKFGSFVPSKVNLIVTKPKPNNRKLINIELENVKPYPVRPIDPFPETPQPPLHSSVGYSVPSSIAKSPPPYSATPPSISPPYAPEQQPPFNGPSRSTLPPMSRPSSPTTLPPCNPADAPAPFVGGVAEELWCVAKPSVPAETLQEALDYACGNGGADCDEIRNPNGKCFYPDSVVAHSSYAFNSYYQKFKRSGGSCSFGGTAMLITSDPSYLNCRFHLS
ncbi:O-Glycosyl hydrolases family 17 protein [Euphorbia peplus]|nr:O-Glycosyl hydrolases family 17 protein [Euphorbia peplus]